MAVGHLLLKSFWANEAVFQMMMISYNLFLLFKFDFSVYFRIQAANQDDPLEVYVSCCEDHQNCKICGYEALSKISA